MRFALIPVLAVLCLVAAPGAAQEAAPDASTQIPAQSPLSVRVTSLERVDVLAKEWIPILKAFGLGDKLAPFEQVPPSAFFFAMSGLTDAEVDKSKPIYIAMDELEEPVVIFHAAPGAAWEGTKELREGYVAALRGGAVVAGAEGSVDLEGRGAATAFLDADLCVHVYLADLIAAKKDELERDAAEVAMQAGGNPALTDAAKALVLPFVSGCKDAFLSLESFDYAFTWKGDRLESEGLLRVKPRTGLREILRAAGKPGTCDLVGYLPPDALMTWTTHANPAWPVQQLADLLDRAAGGEGMGGSAVQILSFSTAMAEHLTGRSAGAMTMGGMMMGGGFLGLYELKPDQDPAVVVGKLDVAKMNAAMKTFGIPIQGTFEKAVAKHGETELHRMTMQSENPMLAMQLSMMQGYYAVEGGLVFMAMSPTAEDDLRGLLDTVRGGTKRESPHGAAMARYGPHHIGFTFNVGALKPMAMMAGMFGAPPEVMQALQNLPASLPLSTAVTFDDGNLRWRGDWPVREVAKIAETMTKAKEEAKKREAKKKTEEDY